MKGNQDQNGRRARAYRAGARVARERMVREAPLDAEALERVGASDILVVPGSFDHVEWVLDALEMPYTTVRPSDLPQMALRPDQLLVVNCPGQGLEGAGDQIRDFVHAGGSLFATDWALLHVVQHAFPGRVEYNQRPTRDDVVRIEVRRHDNPFLRGVMDGADDPQWWLEGSSYPIRVLDPARVEVLIRSRELSERYGEPAVAVLIRHGQGEVFHMISHYYLQRTELRERRHTMAAASYAVEKGVGVVPGMAAAMYGLQLGEVESAATSARFLGNVIASKKRSATKEAK